MPVKIGFQVVASTGEDEKYRAAELNYLGPTARGWRSSANCTFPQEIVLQLKVDAILHQIQILAHQYLIPHKIEICTGRRLEHDSFEYLGFITFSDNRATGFRSRELKSILLPSKKAKYIKLRIYDNHANLKNVYNQVGLMAINVLGTELHGAGEDFEVNNNLSFHPKGLHPSKLTFNSNYLSPFDDLAFQMSVDEETARIIKIMEYKMLQAVFEERGDHANALRVTIENLRAAGEILAIYEQEKRRAVNLEDFDRAKTKKMQIDHFRRRIYDALHVDRFLDEEDDFVDEYDVNSNPEEKISDEGTPSRGSPLREVNGRVPTPEGNVRPPEKSPTRLLRPLPLNFPNQLTHSRSQTFPESPAGFRAPPFSTSVSHPHLHQYLKQTYTTISESHHEARTPSSASDSLPGDEPTPPETPRLHRTPPPRPPHNRNGSLIPRRDGTRMKSPPAEGRGHGDQKLRGKPPPPITKTSFEAYEDRMLPALRSYHGHEVVRECQFAFEQRKSTLNEREKKQAMLPIAVFGIEMIEKFYSKSFTDKEEGLKQLQQELKKVPRPEGEGSGTSWNKIARAAIFLLHRGLRDTVFSVYKLAAETVRLFFAEFVPDRVSPSEIARSVDKLLPELLAKSGDVTPRIHNMAAHTLLSMAECEEVRRLNIIPVQLSRPLTSSVHPRLALSRLEMVEQLILNHGISKDKKSGLTCRTLAEFGSSGLHHPAEPVRKVSERILIHVYKVNPRIVRKQLPPDDNVTRRNLLYRQLFQEFDFMDVQRKLNEQNLEDSMTGCEPNPSLLPGQPFGGQNKQKTTEEVKRKWEIKVKGEPPKTCLVLDAKKEGTGKSPRKNPATPPGKGEGKTANRFGRRREEEEEDEARVDDDGEGSPLKFPSLTDSIRTTKSRILQEERKNLKRERAAQPPIAPPPGRNRLRGEKVSGIPVATFGTLRRVGNPSKKREKSQEEPKKRMLEPGVTEKNPQNSKKNGEPVKFSDRMLASIRENEFSVGNGTEEKEKEKEKEKMCIFCLTPKKWTNQDGLNKHYLTNCLMLTTCEYCMEVTEISGFTNHLLDDCKWKNIFQKCVNCQEAILRDLYDKHECSALPGKVHKSRCPFCHVTIGNEESAWRKHLTGNEICPNHPRQK